MDNKIQQNLVYLADNLTNLDRILLYLRQNNIISQNERDQIRKEDTPFNRNSELLDVILRKELQINIFLEILRKTQNGHCADEIERQLETPKILRNKWWQDKKILVKSLYLRKIGDKLLVEELHERITTDEKRMLVLCESDNVSKLTGLGGVGKTLTSIWYAHHYEHEYDHVIWIDSGEDNLFSSFESLARDLKIENRNELKKVEEYSRKCYETLQELKCLWIFDNAESYREKEGIKDILPKYKENFYCVITSRCREWGIADIGYGQISRLELDVFGEMESLEFLKKNLKEKIKYTECQLKELCALLGNLPLAMILAIAALNTGSIDLKNYIEKTSTKDIENIVDTKFDDYEKTINGNINITLELMSKEEGGAFAKDVLNIFGYIRPDNVEKDFLTAIFYSGFFAQPDQSSKMSKAIKLLTKYSLITQIGDQESKYEVMTPVNVNNDSSFKSSVTYYDRTQDCMIFLSIHRLLQQVIRHKGRNTEKETLRKILECQGFIKYKLEPFTKYADDELRMEFPRVKAELLDQGQLIKLVYENRYQDSVVLAKFINKELQNHVTKFNYAICLDMNKQVEEGIEILEELYREIEEDMNHQHKFLGGMGLLNLGTEVTKSLVGGHLLVSHFKMDNKERLQKILEERKFFDMTESQEMLSLLLRILNSNFIRSNYFLTYEDFKKFNLVLNGDTKKIKLKSLHSVELCHPLPDDLQELVLESVFFKNGNGKDMTDVSEWIPKKLSTLEILCWGVKNIILSLDSIISIENITLAGCSLSLEPVNRISPRQLKLQGVSFIKEGEELSNIFVNEFVDFHKMKRLELSSWTCFLFS